MSSPNDVAAVRNVVEEYIDGSYTANVPLLKSVFHSESLMSGYFNDELEIGSPEPFFLELEKNPSSKETGEAYHAEIIFIHVEGTIASAAIVEDNLLGMNYINHFHLLKIDGEWKIISKIYTTV